MASASMVRKMVIIDVEVGKRCGEKKRFNNTFREEFCRGEIERENRIMINQLGYCVTNRGLIGYPTTIRRRFKIHSQLKKRVANFH